MSELKLVSVFALVALLLSATSGAAMAQETRPDSSELEGIGVSTRAAQDLEIDGPPQPLAGWVRLQAYSVAIAYWWWDGPHWGAWFSGDHGRDQHYLGPGGDAATAPYSGGIANWDWWGNSLSVLMLPRTWLVVGGSEARTADNYSAIVFH